MPNKRTSGRQPADQVATADQPNGEQTVQETAPKPETPPAQAAVPAQQPPPQQQQQQQRGGGEEGRRGRAEKPLTVLSLADLELGRRRLHAA